MEYQQLCKHMKIVDVSIVSKSLILDEKQILRWVCVFIYGAYLVRKRTPNVAQNKK